MKTNTHAHGQSHSIQVGAILLWPFFRECKHTEQAEGTKYSKMTDAHGVYTFIKQCKQPKKDCITRLSEKKYFHQAFVI